MTSLSNLTIGIASKGSVFDELLVELLDHQGILYEIIDDRSEPQKDYPIVLVSRHSGASSVTHGEADSGRREMIVAEDVIDLDQILLNLSGLNDARRDRFDFDVNVAEARLVSSISEKLFSLGLPLVTKSFWPGGAKACCVLTHDVDWLTYSPFHASTLAGGRGMTRAVRLAANMLKGKANYGNNIPEIVRLEKSYAARSTFFFRTGYSDSNLLRESMGLLGVEGFEVGLHGADPSFNSFSALNDELSSIRNFSGGPLVGVRNHLLKFKAPETWLIEGRAGLLYDATLAYNRFFGSRSSICFPFHPFGEKRLPIVELPTTFMDWTALNRGLRGERFGAMLDKTRKMVEQFHGVLVVNFHNTYLNSDTFPDVLAEYESLIQKVSSNAYWIATAKTCVEWWNLRATSKPSPVLERPGVVMCRDSAVPLIVSWEGKETEPLANGQASMAPGLSS